MHNSDRATGSFCHPLSALTAMFSDQMGNDVNGRTGSKGVKGRNFESSKIATLAPGVGVPACTPSSR